MVSIAPSASYRNWHRMHIVFRLRSSKRGSAVACHIYTTLMPAAIDVAFLGNINYFYPLTIGTVCILIYA